MSNQGPPRILVVEDDPQSLQGMLRLLSGNGHSAHGASSCQSAREIFRRERCGLLICDILLPDGSGNDLMRELAPQGVRGIAISGMSNRNDKQASFEAGFSEHISKPILFTELLHALDRVAGAGAGD